MKYSLLTLAAAATLVIAAPACSDKAQSNPFLEEYTNEYEIPPFDKILPEHYMPALKAGIEQHNAEIEAICNNAEAPTFENTVLALDNSGATIAKVALVFGALEESNSSDEMVKIAEDFHPMLSAHQDEVSMNGKLFERIRVVYDNREGLERDQQMLTEKYYKDFVNNGALLDAEGQADLKELNTKLTGLYLTFNNNLLKATNEFYVLVEDTTRLAGLPANVVSVAAEEAAARGHQGKWAFTVHAPCRLPVLQYAQDRELRREIYQGYTSLATSGEYNNYPVIDTILHVRAQKAALLGFDCYGAYQTNKVMAHTVEAAENLLMQIWKPAVARVKEEVAEMQALANRRGDNITIEPWDYYFYSELVRQDKYALDENELRGYFQVDSVRKGIFTMAERLYGVKFTEMPNATKYFDEVVVYDVTDIETGEHVAVYMTDYFSRPSKRQGAWMSVFKESWVNADGTPSRPIVFNVGNFTRPVGDTPALLSIDEVETMFHEFGHGLHGMLTTARYKGISGTSVDRDFVELPSQIHEHWAFTPELLSAYAHHYKTGEVIPQALVDKVLAAANHGQGFATTELCGAALLDLQYGKLNPEGSVDVAAFEKQVADQLGMPAELTFRYRSTYFKHIFGSDEYSCGYYTYLWAEVLDADGFELFQEKGIFDPATAKSFKENILQPGGGEDPMTLFVRFRGHEPSVDALLRGRGLIK